jgi:hypothetical protein
MKEKLTNNSPVTRKVNFVPDYNKRKLLSLILGDLREEIIMPCLDVLEGFEAVDIKNLYRAE